MAKLSAKEEQRLLNAVERSIDMANHGMTPNDAIEKVATDEQYTAPFVERIVQAFNKSASVARFTKEADAKKRKASFPLANTSVILKRMYGPDKEASATDILQFPTNLRSPVMDKVASAEDPYGKYRKLSERSIIRMVDSYKGSMEKLANEMKRREDFAKYQLDEALSKAANHVTSIPEYSLRKLAQTIVNGYPSNGGTLLKLIGVKAGRTIPEMQKTAHAALFPAQEPYISIANIFVNMDKYAKALVCNDKFQSFHKEAAGLEEGVIGGIIGSLGKTLSAGEELSQNEEVRKIKNPELELDPEFFNSLKEVDVRKNFADLVLYDPELSRYDMPTLIKAFNTAAAIAPESINKPPVLKTLMLQHITSGGLLDPAMIHKNLQINKELQGQDKIKKQERDVAKALTSTDTKPKWYQAAAERSGDLSNALDQGREKVNGLVDTLLATKGKKEEPAEKQDVKALMEARAALLDKLFTGKTVNTKGTPDKVHTHALLATLQGNNPDLKLEDLEDIAIKGHKGHDLTPDEQSIHDALTNERGWK